MIEEFLFLRHGESDWNCQSLCVGQQDRPLTPLGREQARKARRAVADYRPDAAFTSPLSRARDTAVIVLEACECELFVEEGIAEVCLGEKEGQPEDERGDDFVAFWLGGGSFSGAEPYPAFQMRVMAAFNRIAASSAGGRPLIVAHWAVHHALSSALGLPPGDIGHCEPRSYRKATGNWSCQIIR